MSQQQRVPKRVRTSASAVSVDEPPMTNFKEKNYEWHALTLLEFIKTRPSHLRTETEGWWCAHTETMGDLVQFIADKPEKAELKNKWVSFREHVARQLQQCTKCARKYHQAVSDWQQEGANSEHRKKVFVQVKELLAWDVSRIRPLLEVGSANDASVWQKRGFQIALFECLLSFRLCLDPTISGLLSDVARKSKLVEDSDLKVFLEGSPILPPGLIALCFHPSMAVRGWAQRTYRHVANTLKPYTMALQYILVKVFRQLGDGSERNAWRGFVADDVTAWDGLRVIVPRLERVHLRLITDLFKPGEILGICVRGLQNSDRRIVECAAQCLNKVFSEVAFTSLFTAVGISPDSFLDTLFLRLLSKELDASCKNYLLLLIAPVIAACQTVCAKSRVSEVYHKCFEFLYDASMEGTAASPNAMLANGYVHADLDGQKHQQALMRTGATLLNWFYTHAAPSLPTDVGKIASFVVRILHADPQNECGWDLLRTVLLTDVFNLVSSIRNERDTVLIGTTFLMKRPVMNSLRKEEEDIMKRVVNAPRDAEKEITWVGPLWEQVRKGKHLRKTSRIVMSAVPTQEMKILLDLHRLVGMVDAAYLERANSSAKKDLADESFTPSTLNMDEQVRVRAYLEAIQHTMRDRFLEACKMDGRQEWWKQLPFHATHLLASANKEIARKAFEALQKSECLEDATVAGSQSRLLAHVLKSDSEKADTMASGCVSAMRIISALGPAISVRTYATFLLWYRVLLDSKYVTLLEDGNSTWALGVVLTFLQSWKSLEKATDPSVFQEVCCRFMSNLRDVWRLLRCDDDNIDDDQDSEFGDARERVLGNVVSGLFGMSDLKHYIPRSSWLATMIQLAPSWKSSARFREQAVLIVQDQEARRNCLTLEQCRKLANSAELSEVAVTLERWSRDEQSSSPQSGKANPKLLTTKIDNYFPKAPSSVEQMRRPLVEKKTFRERFIGKQFASRDLFGGAGVKRIVPNRPPARHNSLLKQSSAVGELLRDHKAARTLQKRVRVRSSISQRVEASSNNDDGKTMMERVVERNRALKKRRLAEAAAAENRDIADVDSLVGTSEHLVDGTGGSVVKPRPIAVDGDDDSGMINSWRLPSRRRRMERRLNEQVIRAILSTDLSNSAKQYNQDLGLHSHESTPRCFEDVESYVQFWEPIVIAEYRAAIVSLVEEETSFAEGNKFDGRHETCRQSFTVDGAVESIGYIQRMTVRLDSESQSAFTRREGTRGSDFDVGQLQVSDLVLMHIAPHKPALDGSAVPFGDDQIRKALGIVSKVEKKRNDFILKLDVAFKHCDRAPANGKKLELSRLTGISTFQRQIDALWSLHGIPDGILWAVLEPDRALKVNKEVRARQEQIYGEQAASRITFVNDLTSRKLLNSSQATAVKEVVHACAPIFRSKGKRPRYESQNIANHGSLTLIQGPPGTGKTSTIIALLSAVLMGHETSPPYRRAQINLDGIPEVIRLSAMRVLVCAPSNAAVDEIMVRVMEDGLYTTSGQRATPRIVRVGGGTTVNAIRNLELRTLAQRNIGYDHSTAKSSSSLARLNALRDEKLKINKQISEADKQRREHESEANAFETKKEQYDKDSYQNELTFRQLTDRLSSLHARKRELERLIGESLNGQKLDEANRKREIDKAICSTVNSASIVFATLSSAGHEMLKKFGATFDLIIIDEAAQSGEPEVLIPITSGQTVKNRVSSPPHVVLVGDPKQLPATVLSREKSVLGALGHSLFERVGDRSQSAVHMLDVQYRMHPSISSFPSCHFYHGLLQNGPNVTSPDMNQLFHCDPKGRFGPLTFLDMSRSRSRELRTSRGSLFNVEEANFIACALTAMLKLYGKDSLKGNVVVLSPYREQVSTLRRIISEKSLLRDADIEVSTIDGIQGREKSVVVLSTVRSGEARSIGFVDDDRRMNVAITRAKHSLIVVGNGSALARHSTLWSSLMSHCERNSAMFVVPEDPLECFPEARKNSKVKLISRRVKATGLKSQPLSNANKSTNEVKRLPAANLRSAIAKQDSKKERIFGTAEGVITGDKIVANSTKPRSRQDGKQPASSEHHPGNSTPANRHSPKAVQNERTPIIDLVTPEKLESKPYQAQTKRQDEASNVSSQPKQRQFSKDPAIIPNGKPPKAPTAAMNRTTFQPKHRNGHVASSRHIESSKTSHQIRSVDPSKMHSTKSAVLAIAHSNSTSAGEPIQSLKACKTSEKKAGTVGLREQSPNNLKPGRSFSNAPQGLSPRNPSVRAKKSFQWAPSKGWNAQGKDLRSLLSGPSPAAGHSKKSVNLKQGGAFSGKYVGSALRNRAPSKHPSGAQERLISQHRNNKRQAQQPAGQPHGKKLKTSNPGQRTFGIGEQRTNAIGFSLARSQEQMKQTREMMRRASGS